MDEQGNQVDRATPAAEPAGAGNATCAPSTIAMAGPLTGTTAVFGSNVLGGVRLAVDQFTRKNPGCPVTVHEFDTTGQPRDATRIAPQIVGDSSIVALIGPVLSGETKSTGQTYSDAGLPFLTPSATDPTLSASGWRTFFRGIPPDNLQGPAVGRHLAAGYGRVCIVADNSDYGTELARGVTSGLGGAALADCAATVKPGDDITATVDRIASIAPEVVYYAGYYSESIPLLQRLRQAGVTAAFISGDGSFDPQFVDRAGTDATGTILSCPCSPATGRFLSDYETANGGAAGTYSVEAYDLTTIVLHGIASGHVTREDLLTYLRQYDGNGVAQGYRWTSAGELAEPRIWLYQIE
ncbi:branched-chain amino acid ABC transporter substrate-binding protein [Nocardia uniformis]|uniref:Branched-chain amino acid ABC transporter substrate-binding protein n=1 Tax=Nocardia uniformis TaxID=53432 RepID=A0A849CBR4_9NOCA|nr:branched-chain amino acid ABC transporter substrate-binding protein [Nocardia uniformis]